MNRNLKQDFRLITSPFRVNPNFIIPGAAKCGTTSLYRYLTQHPDVMPADMKEPKNFIEYGGSGLFCKMHYPLRPRAWPRALAGRRLLTGEASAEYFSRRQVPETIAALLPEVRIIVLLRNPTLRAYSDFAMMQKAGMEPRPFDMLVRHSLSLFAHEGFEPVLEALDEVEHHPYRYVYKGLYARVLERWKRCFSPDRLLVLESASFFADPRGTLRRVFAFLGLADHEIPDLSVKKQGDYRRESVPRESLEVLARFYAPHNRALYELLGEDFGWEREIEAQLLSPGPVA